MAKKLLLHACCGPCAIRVLQIFEEEEWDVSCFFFNPNIHPYKEFERRLEGLNQVVEMRGSRLIVSDEYPLEEFLRGQLGAIERGEKRCSYCYNLRLFQTASTAKSLGFGAFSTTLLVSPYQDHQLVKEIGETMMEKLGIEFVYRDFRGEWKEGVRLSREAGLYMQGYCGCLFSERDRYCKKTD